MLINVPTLRTTNLNDYKLMLKWWHQACETKGDVFVNFSQCDVIKQNFIVFIECLRHQLHKEGRSLMFNFNSMKPNVRQFIQETNFPIENFGGIQNSTPSFFATTTGMSGHNFKPHQVLQKNETIPFCKYYEKDEEDVLKYLENQWLGLGWVNLSKELEGKIVGTVWEIFANAFEHADSLDSVCVCGMHSQENYLELSVMDVGVGIPSQVLRYLHDCTMTRDQALEWAFTKGNSTRREDNPGGLGLDLLKEFINLNRGSMSIFSGGAYARFYDGKEYFGTIETSSFGTLVNISIKCDENYYYMAN